MRFTTFVTGSLPIASMLLAGSLMAKAPTPVSAVATPAIVSVSPFIEGQVSEALEEIQSRAGALSRETETLRSFARAPSSNWRSHATQLTATKEHINAIGERLDYLQTVKHASAAWQQEAIERITPIASEVASRTTAAMQHLNENQSQLFTPSYRDNVKALSEQADALKRSIDPFVELNETQKRLEAIQNRLAESES